MLARYKWAERATAKIRFRPDREAVARELLEHIQDLLDHYGETGMGEEAAEAAALAAMGDPEAIADFMWEINSLIGESELLLNTNHWMLNLEEDGRPRDNILVSLNHPDTWDFSSKDELLAGLVSYAGYAGDHPDSTRSPLEDLLAEIGAADIGDISGQDIAIN